MTIDASSRGGDIRIWMKANFSRFWYIMHIYKVVNQNKTFRPKSKYDICACHFVMIS